MSEGDLNKAGRRGCADVAARDVVMTIAAAITLSLLIKVFLINNQKYSRIRRMPAPWLQRFIDPSH
jgi:hypothetical protein